MKKILIALSLAVIFTYIARANADITVVRDKNTNEVLFLTDSGDVKLSEADAQKYETVVIPDKTLKDIEIREAPQDYKFVNDRFVVNTQKISDRENDKEVQSARDAEMEAVQKKAYLDAFTALKAGGQSFKYISADDFK